MPDTYHVFLQNIPCAFILLFRQFRVAGTHQAVDEPEFGVIGVSKIKNVMSLVNVFTKGTRPVTPSLKSLKTCTWPECGQSVARVSSA